MTATLQALPIPLLIAAIAIYGASKKIDVFSCFCAGAKKGLYTAFHILPTMLGMITAVYLLRSSGAIDLFARFAAPLFAALGIPPECSTLVLLGPVSGAGSLALGSELMARYGVDSQIGKTAAILLGASETSFYTLGLYSAHIGLKRLRYAVPAALSADLAAAVLAAALARLL